MSTPKPVESRILEAALELGYAKGADHIGSREVSRRAAITPSAINYHFDSIEGLRQAVARAAQEGQDADMRAALESAVSRLPHLQSLPGFAGGLAALMIGPRRERTLLLDELASQGIVAASANSGYWSDAATRFGCPEQATVWELLFNGVLRFAVVDSDAVATAMWTSRVAQRIDARLARRPDPPARTLDSPPAAPAAEEPPEQSPRARQIIDAAAALLMEGIKVSHRAVAERAGVPLGTTTYFFASKADIVLEAYKAITRRTHQPSVSQQWHSAIGDPFTPDGNVRSSFLALHRLGLSAARDPALAPLAAAMRDARGQSSTSFLKAAGLADADRLDGLIWSLFHGSAQSLALALPPAERAAAFEAMLRNAWKALFGNVPFQH